VVIPGNIRLPHLAFFEIHNGKDLDRFCESAGKAVATRAMSICGLLRRINESWQGTEALLPTAAQRMEAAESAIEAQFKNEGLRREEDSPDSLDEERTVKSEKESPPRLS
jgi:hypothetical protein